MKTIVAPVDFSAISLNAADYAADLACVMGKELALLHVCITPLSFSEVPAPAYAIAELAADAEAKLKELRDKILFRIKDRTKVLAVVGQGGVVQEIDNYCAEVNPYAVVMGAESAGAFERFLTGGKTIAAVRELSWPLIIVPPDVKFASIRKIGLACDFRKVTETIPLQEIESLVSEFKAELHVLHVSTESVESVSEATIDEAGWLQDILGELKPKYHFIRDEDIERGIAEFADKNNLDLLIIIPKRHDVVSKIFRHSHSTRLVLHTHVPVMAIHE